jgi:hypothetical protein
MLILQLNNGKSIYLAPGEESEPLENALVNGNDKIAKLLRNSLVATSAAGEEPATSKKAKAKKKT